MRIPGAIDNPNARLDVTQRPSAREEGLFSAIKSLNRETGAALADMREQDAMRETSAMQKGLEAWVAEQQLKPSFKASELREMLPPDEYARLLDGRSETQQRLDPQTGKLVDVETEFKPSEVFDKVLGAQVRRTLDATQENVHPLLRRQWRQRMDAVAEDTLHKTRIQMGQQRVAEARRERLQELQEAANRGDFETAHVMAAGIPGFSKAERDTLHAKLEASREADYHQNLLTRYIAPTDRESVAEIEQVVGALRDKDVRMVTPMPARLALAGEMEKKLAAHAQSEITREENALTRAWGAMHRRVLWQPETTTDEMFDADAKAGVYSQAQAEAFKMLRRRSMDEAGAGKDKTALGEEIYFDANRMAIAGGESGSVNAYFDEVLAPQLGAFIAAAREGQVDWQDPAMPLLLMDEPPEAVQLAIQQGDMRTLDRMANTNMMNRTGVLPQAATGRLQSLAAGDALQRAAAVEDIAYYLQRDGVGPFAMNQHALGAPGLTEVRTLANLPPETRTQIVSRLSESKRHPGDFQAAEQFLSSAAGGKTLDEDMAAILDARAAEDKEKMMPGFAGWLDRLGAGDVAVPPQMLEQAKLAYRSAYKATGSREFAQAAAADATRIYAPVKQETGDWNWVAGAPLEPELQAELFETARFALGVPDDGKVAITSANGQAQFIREGAPIEYNVNVFDADGGFTGVYSIFSTPGEMDAQRRQRAKAKDARALERAGEAERLRQEALSKYPAEAKAAASDADASYLPASQRISVPKVVLRTPQVVSSGVGQMLANAVADTARPLTGLPDTLRAKGQKAKINLLLDEARKAGGFTDEQIQSIVDMTYSVRRVDAEYAPALQRFDPGTVNALVRGTLSVDDLADILSEYPLEP